MWIELARRFHRPSFTVFREQKKMRILSLGEIVFYLIITLPIPESDLKKVYKKVSNRIRNIFSENGTHSRAILYSFVSFPSFFFVANEQEKKKSIN